MRIFLLKSKRDVGYDEYDGFVVSAPDPQTAKQLCKAHCGRANWADFNDPHITVVGRSRLKTPRVVLASFNAG